MTTPYDRINSLEEFEIIGGESFTIYFDVVDENDIPVDITAGVSSWVLAPYGQPSYVALTKSGTATEVSQFSVELETADTSSLSGKYIQQAIHIDFDGKEFRKQGLVTIVPRIA